jgi:amino acid transporter
MAAEPTVNSGPASGIGPDDAKHRLAGRLGAGSIIFMIMAAAAPLTTVSATTPVAVLTGNGAAYPIMYVAAGIILGFFAVGFTAMTPHVRNAGAFYAYITEGLGRGWGLAAAFLALLTYSAVQLAVHAFMGVVLQDFVLSFGGPDIAWWVFSALSILVVAILGYQNIELSGKVLGVVLVAEVLICVVFAVAVVMRGGGSEGLSTAFLQPSEMLSGSPALALMFAVSGFLGFEAAAVYRDEARDPNTTIPRATYGALIVIGLFYAIVAWTIISAYGDKGVLERAETSSATMFLDAARQYIGVWGFEVMQYLLIGSVFAGILSFHNVIARYIFSLANTDAMPAKAGLSHPKHRSPYVASVVQSASAAMFLAICVVFGLDPISQVFTWLVGVATIGILILMLGTCIAVVAFFRSNEVDARPWHTIVAPALGCIGLGVATVITAWNLPLLMGSKPLAFVVAGVLAVTISAGFVVAAIRPHANADRIEHLPAA